MTLSPEQLAARSKGLGGSDVAALLGLSPWKSPVDLWAEKTGHKEREEIGDKDHIIFGHLCEDIVAQEFARRLGKKVRRDNKIRVHPKYPFMVGNIDRDIVGERAGLEVKTSSAWLQQHWGETGTDDFPLYYITQCVHYMEIYDYDLWYCAVLIGGNEFRWYVIKRDEQIAADLIRKESEFWRLVLAKEPPDPRDFPDVCTLYPKDNGAPIVATNDIFEKLAAYENLRHEIASKEQQRDHVKKEICEFMGNAGRLVDRAGTKLATWLSHERNDIDAALLKRDYPEVYKDVLKSQTVRPFRT